MAFNIKKYGIPWSSTAGVLPGFTTYDGNAAGDAIATIVASGYFNSIADDLYKGNIIQVFATDQTELVAVTSENGVTPVTVVQITGAASNIPLANGDYFVGNASGIATPVTMSGHVTQTNAGVTSISSDVVTNTHVNSAAAIALSKLAATTASRALVSDGSGVISPATTTATEIGYVNGVTSSIQTQLDGKVSSTLTSANIFVGNGSNVATGVAVSQDATMDNTGAFTVISSNGNFEMGAGGSGTYIKTSISSSSGAAAVPLTHAIHEITTTGTGDALTLADGTAGQRLTLLYVAEGAGSDTAVLTPTTLAGGTTITFNALGDCADLTFSATGGWYMHGGTAAIA